MTLGNNMNGGYRAHTKPSSLYSMAVSEPNKDLRIGKHCIHHCSDDVPLECLCSVCLPSTSRSSRDEEGSGNKSRDATIDWREASKSVVGWRDQCGVERNSEGDVIWNPKAPLHVDSQEKVPVKEKLSESSKTGLSNVNSVTSIASIISMVSDIESSVELIGSSLDEILLQMKRRTDTDVVASKAKGVSGLVSKAASYTTGSGGSTSSTSTSRTSSSEEDSSD